MHHSDLLFELGTEELPPVSLKTLRDALKKNVVDALKAKDFEFDEVEAFATPRRLALIVRDLSDAQPDKEVERLGPAVAAAFDDDGNAKPAAAGFAKSCGVEVDQLERIQTDKGERLGYTISQKGQTLSDLIEDILTGALKKLPIPKPMRWGDSSAQFIRPVHWTVLLYGSSVLDATILETKTGNISHGHRFMAEGPVSLHDADDYVTKLKAENVLVDYEDRQRIITEQVKAEAEKLGGFAQIDPDLLDEVTGLVEWPVALTGQFDTEFLKVPSECLISSMAEHQKYFHILDKSGNLLPNFITISNIESSNPRSVIEGNEKVIRPRLADAMFFYDKDQQTTLESQQERLKKVVFQKQLGTVQEKAERVAELAKTIAPTVGADPELAHRAGLLSKCDLTTQMVGEFDKLQGIMGTYYARHDGEDESVAIAMTEQYLPKFSGDKLAANPVGQCLAIADRVDTLVGIFGIGQAPKGAKDPFALRRAAIGLVRTLIEKKIPLDLKELIHKSIKIYGDVLPSKIEGKLKEQMENVLGKESPRIYSDVFTREDVIEFIFNFGIERLRSWYFDQGINNSMISSVLAIRPTQPLDFDLRLKAVQHFQTLPEAESLSAANKRVKNILAKADVEVPDSIDSSLLQESAEKSLAKTIASVESELASIDNYQERLTRMAALRHDVDAFFDHVMVNADDPAIKANRLALLKKLEDMFGSVADISQLQN
ncbi:glycine--tRNA ligase subunit beta [Kangiella sediminilitoris]|uniref:Glycine--tRNA ligase beta subunit n=1 Tax=Kangiella sediminilitoris TaxID=1144748 RepID=A0A1B3BDQ7_9GAMM|nr:glycine--tRNA ligase subunit beta [Kangiella sediminilitoris]AOE50941.1 glycyl-tRNA synthetase [Kangiella sediminilitoris]